MQDHFIVLNFYCARDLADILIAELSLAGFDAFLENDNGFQCSLASHAYDKNFIRSLVEKYGDPGSIKVETSELEPEDWNKVWESNFPPVIVENKVLVRAPFHKESPDFKYTIQILPKMSFGTGHHETTYMMIQSMLGLDFNNKKVLDAGCGTGILSIMAEKLGAISVTAIDTDEWAVGNAHENTVMNRCSGITIFNAAIKDLPGRDRYDIILANINRNILIEELPEYSKHAARSAMLVLSGFYSGDSALIESKAARNRFIKSCGYERNRWMAIVFQKKSGYFT